MNTNPPNKMRYLLIIILLTLVLPACSWLKPRYKSDREGQTLPSINLTLNDTIADFNTGLIKQGAPFVIFLYQPFCPYCRAETEDILKNIRKFQNLRIYLITSYSFSEIKEFSNIYRLEKYPNVILARDSSEEFMNYFKAPGVPYIAFYNEKRILKQVVIGKTDFRFIDEILTN